MRQAEPFNYPQCFHVRIGPKARRHTSLGRRPDVYTHFESRTLTSVAKERNETARGATPGNGRNGPSPVKGGMVAPLQGWHVLTRIPKATLVPRFALGFHLAFLRNSNGRDVCKGHAEGPDVPWGAERRVFGASAALLSWMRRTVVFRAVVFRHPARRAGVHLRNGCSEGAE